MILLSFTAAALKLALFALIAGALIMFFSWLRVRKSGKQGFAAIVLLWTNFLVRLLIVVLFFGLIILFVRVIFT